MNILWKFVFVWGRALQSTRRLLKGSTSSSLNLVYGHGDIRFSKICLSGTIDLEFMITKLVLSVFQYVNISNIYHIYLELALHKKRSFSIKDFLSKCDHIIEIKRVNCMYYIWFRRYHEFSPDIITGTVPNGIRSSMKYFIDDFNSCQKWFSSFSMLKC